MDKLLQLYPQDPAQGSPYDTGTQNALTPEFKRMASILGDLVFQAPRRLFLNTVAAEQNTWSYCTSDVPFAYPCRSLTVPLAHSKQTPEVAAHTRLGPCVRSSEYLWRGRPDGIPNPICHEPRS
jgi:hypothetical protein